MGRNIVEATIHDLENANLPTGLNITEAPLIILSGSSAGGMGVFNNLDWLAEHFQNQRVIGYDDSGWIPEMNLFAPLADTPTVQKTSDGFNLSYTFWEAKPDASCVLAHPNNIGLCGTTEVLSKIESPLFISILQKDVAMLGNLGVPINQLASPSPDLQSYLDLFRTKTTTAPAKGYFIPKGIGHVLNKEFHSRKISGVTLDDAFYRWEQGSAEPKQFFE